MNKLDSYKKLLASATVSINGEIFDHSKDAKISVFDRGFLYGDSIYEVAYGKNYHLMFLDEHITRLFRSADILGMQILDTPASIIKQIIDTAKHAAIKDAYVRIVLTRGESPLTLDTSASFSNNIVIIVTPRHTHPQKFYHEGIALYIAEIQRNCIKAMNPNAKSGNYLNNVLAMSQAKDYGADDAIMVNSKGNIAEGTTFNIWCVKNNIFYTPPVTSGLLEGITRQKVINICLEQKFKLQIKDITPAFLLSADEMFITSSTRGIMPVEKVNEKTFFDENTPRSFVARVSQLYQEILDQEVITTGYTYK